ncbi:hypothetical protein [Williamsia muralis]|nr:hypothetical protein [Williamsia marianensis]PVY33738.1 hypothetical protein C7458_101137 [Williamsia marianensis]
MDLFVDVNFDLVHSPTGHRLLAHMTITIGGTAAHLLHTPTPFTFVRGAA